jgi:hypothetical protein
MAMPSPRNTRLEIPDVLMSRRVHWRAVAVDMAATRSLAQGYLSEVAIDNLLFEAEDSIPAGTEFRLLVQMPSNRRDSPASTLDVSCKVRHATIAREVVELRLAIGSFMKGGREVLEAASGVVIAAGVSPA